MRTIRFNTGRKYTSQGQRITATFHDDGVVTFFDHDRMIDGQLTEEPVNNVDQSLVLRAYDRGAYKSTHRSWCDGMLRGGVNCGWRG